LNYVSHITYSNSGDVIENAPTIITFEYIDDTSSSIIVTVTKTARHDDKTDSDRKLVTCALHDI